MGNGSTENRERGNTLEKCLRAHLGERLGKYFGKSLEECPEGFTAISFTVNKPIQSQCTLLLRPENWCFYWCFQGEEKGRIGNEWVKCWILRLLGYNFANKGLCPEYFSKLDVLLGQYFSWYNEQLVQIGWSEIALYCCEKYLWWSTFL